MDPWTGSGVGPLKALGSFKMRNSSCHSSFDLLNVGLSGCCPPKIHPAGKELENGLSEMRRSKQALLRTGHRDSICVGKHLDNDSFITCRCHVVVLLGNISAPLETWRFASSRLGGGGRWRRQPASSGPHILALKPLRPAWISGPLPGGSDQRQLLNPLV